MPSPDDVIGILRAAYDRRADERDAKPAPFWETLERDAFAVLLRDEHRHSLLELGAATGTDASFFAARGFDVVCVDLSPEMVRRCLAKGLAAHVMDVSDLRFPASCFDAVYAMNCLVHVPKAELPRVLAEIRRVLVPDGIVYIGLYGGLEFEGVWDDDHYVPKRFFSHQSDEAFRGAVAKGFELDSFKRVPHGWNGLHFQSLVLRKVATSGLDG